MWDLDNGEREKKILNLKTACRTEENCSRFIILVMMSNLFRIIHSHLTYCYYENIDSNNGLTMKGDKGNLLLVEFPW